MDESLKTLLRDARSIAVIGLSADPFRPSYDVSAYMQSQGYKLIPVNPAVAEVLGERSYASLAEVPLTTRVDIVNIFRRSEFVLEVVDQAIARKQQDPQQVRAIWMQLGVVHEEAAAKARAAGIEVVMDRCLLIEHRRLGVGPR